LIKKKTPVPFGNAVYFILRGLVGRQKRKPLLKYANKNLCLILYLYTF